MLGSQDSGGGRAHSEARAGCRGQEVRPRYRHPSKGEPQKGEATLPWSNHLTPQASQVRQVEVEKKQVTWRDLGYLPLS